MPANFFPLPSKNPAMHGGPLLLSFGLHSPKAMDYCCESDEDVIINNRFPTFRNEMADCLRTGMLSALHYLDPECRMDMTGLQDMAPRPEIPGMDDKIAGVNFTPKLTQVFTNTVPFVCNTGSSSAAAAGLSAMRFYNRTLSLEQGDIEKLLKLKPGQHGAGPIGQLSKVFTKLGYKTKIYRGQQRNLNNNQLRKVLARKQLSICTVDYNKLHKRRKASVQPHTVCITGFDHSQMVLHENGAARLGRPHTPYYMVPTRLFERARIAGAPTLLVKARKIRKAPSPQLGA